MINNPFSKIIEIQGRMFQVKRILPESKIKIDKFAMTVDINYF